MPKVLVVDDDESMRRLLRLRLADACEIIDTGEPEQALSLALEHRPDAILLDLMMPKYSGFQLLQSLRSLSYTCRIPIFVITGEAGMKYREYCQQLGATAYFEKPIDFKKLKESLLKARDTPHSERRAHVRVRMQIGLTLRGTDATGKRIEELTTTENASAGGFLCPCVASWVYGATVEVFLSSGT